MKSAINLMLHWKNITDSATSNYFLLGHEVKLVPIQSINLPNSIFIKTIFVIQILLLN